MRFEHKSQPLLPWPQFLVRLLSHAKGAAVLLTFSLMVGVAGYRFLAGFPWMDALLNASMILSGMGPVGELPGNVAKAFASLYALYSGIVFLAAFAWVLAPIAHRLLHRFHLEGGN